MSLPLLRLFWAIIRPWIIVAIFPRFCTKSCVLDSYLLYVLYNHQVLNITCANLSKFVWQQKIECIRFTTRNRWLLMDYIFILITCKSQKRKDIFTSTLWHHHIYSVNYFSHKITDWVHFSYVYNLTEDQMLTLPWELNKYFFRRNTAGISNICKISSNTTM